VRAVFLATVLGCGGSDRTTTSTASPTQGDELGVPTDLADVPAEDVPAADALTRPASTGPFPSTEELCAHYKEARGREAGLSLTRSGEATCEEVAAAREGGSGEVLEAAAFSTVVRQGDPVEARTTLDIAIRGPAGWTPVEEVAAIDAPPDVEVEVGVRVSQIALRQVIPDGAPEVVVEFESTNFWYEAGQAVEHTLREQNVAVCGEREGRPTCYAVVPRRSTRDCAVYEDRFDPFSGADVGDLHCPNRRSRLHAETVLDVRIGSDGLLFVSTRHPVGDRLGPIIGRFDLRTARVRPSE